MTDSFAAAVFWVSVGVLAYVSVGYPVLVWVLSVVRPRRVMKNDSDYFPTVALIIAAYNEEKVIGAKLQNSMALTYPTEKLEILVAADGSDDRTAEIVSSFGNPKVKLLHYSERQGKSAAISRAVLSTASEIVLFSDANTVYSPDTVLKMVRNFSDPTVGAVSGKKILLRDDERAATEGETAYWTYESWLKRSESRLASIVTADGEIFAVRRSLFEMIPPGMVHDDMYLTLKIVQKGYRVVYEEEALSAEHASKTLRDEFQLKVRYASAGFQIMGAFRGLFLPPRSWFAFEFISHKLLRWLFPFYVLGILLSSAFLGGPVYRTIFWLQVLFYALGLLGWSLQSKIRSTLLYFPHYFTMISAAALYGLLRHLSAGQSALWRKAER
jgi:poly-beta-1,6-N-acetyl-D-glucosamine synthase